MLSSLSPLLIRADSGPDMGTGHIMRCLALAQEWGHRGGRVIFLSHCPAKDLADRIRSSEFDLHLLSTPDDIAINEAYDLFHRHHCRWMVADGYHFRDCDLSAFRRLGFRILLLDDFLHRKTYNADIILNQNPGSESLFYPCSPGTKTLLGSRYTLLRDEFLTPVHSQRPDPKNSIRILVTMGGADPHNVTRLAVDTLVATGHKDIFVTLLLGPHFQHMTSIQRRLDRAPFPSKLIMGSRNMAQHMARADLAVAAAGSTAWELLFLGVPSVFLVTAENQSRVAQSISRAQAGINAGWFANHTPQTLQTVLRPLLDSLETVRILSENARKLVDGRGRQRVVSAMLTHNPAGSR